MISGSVTLGTEPPEPVMVIEGKREVVFVRALGEGGSVETMSYAVNRRDLTMMVVPDWEKPGYMGEPNWTGTCAEDAQISACATSRKESA